MSYWTELNLYNCDAFFQERIATVENAIEHIVQFLGRRIGERKSAVTLLLELSKCESVRDSIGKVQGCILLLVTMLSNTDLQAARDAKNVLDNLSYSDDNVILMAKNNCFTYLLERLSSGIFLNLSTFQYVRSVGYLGE